MYNNLTHIPHVQESYAQMVGIYRPTKRVERKTERKDFKAVLEKEENRQIEAAAPQDGISVLT